MLEPVQEVRRACCKIHYVSIKTQGPDDLLGSPGLITSEIKLEHTAQHARKITCLRGWQVEYRKFTMKNIQPAHGTKFSHGQGLLSSMDGKDLFLFYAGIHPGRHHLQHFGFFRLVMNLVIPAIPGSPGDFLSAAFGKIAAGLR